MRVEGVYVKLVVGSGSVDGVCMCMWEIRKV